MKMNYNTLNTPCNNYPSLLVTHTQQKNLQTNDKPILIVINVFLVAILFNFHHAPSV